MRPMRSMARCRSASGSAEDPTDRPASSNAARSTRAVRSPSAGIDDQSGFSHDVQGGTEEPEGVLLLAGLPPGPAEGHRCLFERNPSEVRSAALLEEHVRPGQKRSPRIVDALHPGPGAGPPWPRRPPRAVRPCRRSGGTPRLWSPSPARRSSLRRPESAYE
jgi:hypothetical protein